MGKKGDVVADSTLITGAGLLGAVSSLELPPGLDNLGEPLGLVLAVLGAVLKLVSYFQARKNGK